MPKLEHKSNVSLDLIPYMADKVMFWQEDEIV
jgi:hypothetical protein